MDYSLMEENNYHGEALPSLSPYDLEYGGVDLGEELYFDYEEGFSLEELFGIKRRPEDVTVEVLHAYVCPLLLLLAILGNLISLLVMFKMSFKVLSTCGYLSLLCVADLLVLFITCGNDWLTHHLGYDLTMVLMKNSDVYCRTYAFVERFIGHLSRWLVVAVIIDGVMLTSFSKNGPIWLTRFRARTVMLLLTLVLILLNIHFFWTYMMMESREAGLIRTHCGFVKFGIAYNKAFQVTIWPLIDLTVSDIIPFGIVGLCSGVMAVSIFKGKPMHIPEDLDCKSNFLLQRKAIKNLRLTFCILGICFIILNTPNLAWKIKMDYTYEKLFPTEEHTGVKESSADTEVDIDYAGNANEFDSAIMQQSRDRLMKAIFSIIWYIFLANKFFLYLLTSPKFRQEIRSLFCCHWCLKAIRRYRDVGTKTNPHRKNRHQESGNLEQEEIGLAEDVDNQAEEAEVRHTIV